MRPPKCTIDSSCVIALDHLNLMPQLSLLFSRVLVPKAVREDLFKRRSTKDHLRSMFNQYAFLERCDQYDKGAVGLLLAERASKGMRDRGEAEAVVQAAQLGATVIVDDLWGRNLAASHALEHHGIIWVLEQFLRLELMSTADFRNCFLSLRRRRIWLPWDIVNERLVAIGELPLES
jgi:predicted nucleic acid-binding protein